MVCHVALVQPNAGQSVRAWDSSYRVVKEMFFPLSDHMARKHLGLGLPLCREPGRTKAACKAKQAQTPGRTNAAQVPPSALPVPLLGQRLKLTTDGTLNYRTLHAQSCRLGLEGKLRPLGAC